MSIRRVAFVPSAPLLVPAVAGGSAGLDADLREASIATVRWAIAQAPAQAIVVSQVAVAGESPTDASWDFAGFGVARQTAAGQPVLPWQLGIGSWLLDEAGCRGPRRYLGVSATDVAARLPEDHGGDVAIVVVGDGSACRTEKAPGYLDERAEAFDLDVAGRLADGDVAGLGGIDRDLAADLLCGGWPAWAWLAAAASGATVTEAELVTHVAPYGVAYLVARWTLAS